MKHIITTLALTLFSITSMFAQTKDTIIYVPDELGIEWFKPQPEQPVVQNQVFLYPGSIVRDTISAVEFTYIKNRTLKHRTGQLVEVSQLWTTEPGGGTVVLKKSQEFYVISDKKMRYEIKNLMVGKVLCNSQTKPVKKFLKWFRRKPEYVWEIKLI